MSKPFKRKVTSAVDETDREIIKQLQEDGRRTYGRIAEAVGLSEAAVRQRVSRLVKSDVIRIAATTNPRALGFKVRATMCLRCDGDVAAVIEKLSQLEEVDFLVATAGNFDVMAQVWCRDDEHLYSLLNDSVRKIRGIRSTETYIYLTIAKASYPWPPGSGDGTQ